MLDCEGCLDRDQAVS